MQPDVILKNLSEKIKSLKKQLIPATPWGFVCIVFAISGVLPTHPQGTPCIGLCELFVSSLMAQMAIKTIGLHRVLGVLKI
jgi:hypothetical protein